MGWDWLSDRFVCQVIYIFGVLIAALFLTTGVAKCEHERANGYKVTIESIKAQSKQLMDAQLVKNKAKEIADKESAIRNQKDYDEALKTLVADNAKYRTRLRDPGSRSCPTGTQGSTDTGTPKDVSVDGGISDEAGAFLRAEADRANEVTRGGFSCWQHVNKKSVRDQVKELRK